MAIEREGNYWVDQNNNRWRTEWYFEKEAEEYSASLINCRNCTNCKDCTDCTDCWSCHYCRKCTDCTDCDSCTDCRYCFFCNNCTNCVAFLHDDISNYINYDEVIPWLRLYEGKRKR